MPRFVLIALTLLAGSPAAAQVRVGDAAPELSDVTTFEGAEVTLAGAAAGKRAVVLTFGASWCKPCARELPAWDGLARKHPDVTFIAVNIDSDRRKGRAFVRELGLTTLTVGYDPAAKTVARYDPPRMPTTWIVVEGRVVALHEGYRDGDEDTLSNQLDRLAR